MSPAIKTFLKVLLGAAATAVAGVLLKPETFAGFGAIAGVVAAIGAVIASYLEKFAASA